MDKNLHVSRSGTGMVSRVVKLLGVTLFALLATFLLFSGSGSSNPLVYAAGDLDGDGRTEEYILEGTVITVKEGTQDLWESPSDYRVDSFVLGDVDNDGRDNLVVSLWKEGSFGEIRPFWHIGEDAGYKNHLFVYALQGDRFKPVWCSSDLDRPLLSFAIRDVNGDGLNELVAEEGQYRKVAGERYAPDPYGNARTAVWQWEEWGFSLLAPL